MALVSLVHNRDNKMTKDQMNVFEKLQQPKALIFLKEFQKSLVVIIELGRQAGLERWLDRRIIELPKLFAQASLWKIPHPQVLAEDRLPFQKRFAEIISSEFRI